MRLPPELPGYQVIENIDGLLGLWPLDGTPPSSWHRAGCCGTAAQCIDFVVAQHAAKDGTTRRDTHCTLLRNRQGEHVVWPDRPTLPPPMGWEDAREGGSFESCFGIAEQLWPEADAAAVADAQALQSCVVIADAPTGTYAVWRADEPIPIGFHAVGKAGTRAACEAYVRRYWADVYPQVVRSSPPLLEAAAARAVAERLEQAALDAVYAQVVEPVANLALQRIAQAQYQQYEFAHAVVADDERKRSAASSADYARRVEEARSRPNPAEQSSYPMDISKEFVFVGEVRLYAGERLPAGWLPCDGRLLAIQAHVMLFTVIGTHYGGDGQTNFALPDLRGCAPVHAGSGAGLSPIALGERRGGELLTPGGDSTHAVRTTGELGLNFIIAVDGLFPMR